MHAVDLPMAERPLVAKASRLHSMPAAETRCPLCNSDRQSRSERFTSAANSTRWQVWNCGDCGQHYTWPRPSRCDLEALYCEQYRPFHATARDLKIRGIGGWRPIRDRRLFAPFGGRNLLDIGCGGGDYLATMRSLGWTATGIDPSPIAASNARSAHGLIVHVGEFPGTALAETPFDLVTAWEVLEHVADPGVLLAAIRERLATNGRLSISVPNQGGWAARYFGADWFGLDMPRHRFHFDRATLRRLLQANGFAIEVERTIGHPSWIRKSASAARGNVSIADRWIRRRLCSGICSRLAVVAGRGESILVVARLNSDGHACTPHAARIGGHR